MRTICFMIEPQGGPLAVLSDIHANIEAFSRVLEDIDSQGITDIMSLGDVVGYGPDPEACTRIIMDRSIPCVLGNHEKGLRPKECPTNLNPVARDALNRTACLMEYDSANHLLSLPRKLESHGCLFVHGCPPDDVTTYLYKFDQEGLQKLFRQFDHRVCFVGHTHELQLFAFDSATVRQQKFGQETVKLNLENRYIVNVGSVGQPRDGTPDAKYVIFNPQEMTVETRFIPYDIQKTVDRIEELGFSKSLAVRLWG